MTEVFRPLTQYLVEAPLAAITDLSLLGYDTSFAHLGLGIFLPLLCQVGWGLSVDSHFQVSPKIFDWVQVRALAGPLKDIHRVFPKALLRCLGRVLRVIVLLEGEPSAQSEVLSALDQVSIKDISTLS